MAEDTTGPRADHSPFGSLGRSWREFGKREIWGTRASVLVIVPILESPRVWWRFSIHVAGEPEQTRRALSVMEQRELKTKVMRFVGEIGIAPAGKAHTVAFDVVRGEVGTR